MIVRSFYADHFRIHITHINSAMAIYRLSDSKPSTILIPDQSERIALGLAATLAHNNAPFWIYADSTAGLLTPFATHFAPTAEALPAMPQAIIDCNWIPSQAAPALELVEIYPVTPVLFTTPCATSTQLQAMYGASTVIRFNATPSLFPETKTIEVAPSLSTTQEALHLLERYFTLLGFHIEVVGDVVGFVVPRVLAMLINEAAFAVMENVATPADIDAAMRLGTNYPKGPLEWADEIGVDLVLMLLDALHNEYKQERYRACPLIRQYVRAGRFGRLVRKGFYEYDTAGQKLV